MSENSTYLILGLGNPGREYANTRHNMGFMLLDRLAQKQNAHAMKVQSKAIIIEARLGEKKLLLAKPQTYMNLSGQAAQGLIHFYKLPLEQVLVAHDDLDLPLGVLRLRPGGGAGGQKGVRSIIEHLGTPQFARLRLGIDRPPGRMDAAAYVLQNFSPQESALVNETLERAAEAALAWMNEGLNAAMNQFNPAAPAPQKP